MVTFGPQKSNAATLDVAVEESIFGDDDELDVENL